MTTAVLEREGTAEEIQEWLDGFAGQRLHVIITPTEEVSEATDTDDITTKILKRFANVPPEERAKVPADLTDNLNRYI